MTTELTVLGACPLDCPDTCSWVVTVRDGRAVDLRGDSGHPFTRGSLCTKVNRYLEHAAAPDRITHPLRRVGPKGSGRFERITWDAALDEISVRLREIIDRYGGQAIWPYWGTGSLGFVQGLGGSPGRRFFNVLGASDHAMTICSIAGSAGLTYTTGTSAGIDPEDLSRAKLIILWGTNTLTTGHHLWKFIQAARQDGAHVVAIDPLRTRTASQADEHLAPIPGTDAALALGLLNVVVGLGAQDREFLAEHTLGWPEFRERIEQYPADKVAELTGVPAERIVALGTRIATTRPTAIRATMGMQRHAGGGTALRTLACIPGVTGDWARPGGGLSYSTTAHFPLDRAALYRDDLRPGPVRTLSMTLLAHILSTVDDPPVRALIVQAANPAASTPDQNAVRRELAREDLFTVVVEQFPTDTVDYADIVLPTTMQTEHADLHNGYGHMYLAWNEPAVAPPGECLPATEMFRLLAGRMGLTEPSLYDSDERLAEQALGSGDPALSGITLDRLRANGYARLAVPKPFLPFANGFPTPSGRLEFRSARAEADGLDPLPGYLPAAEVVSDRLAARYPLVLISIASHHFLNTVFGNNAELRRRAGRPRVVLHPSDAAARGLATGAEVRVTNDRGAFHAELEVGDWVRPGVAATTKGHWAKLTGGSSVNATVDERDADLGGGAVFHDNRVEITPA
ncbi:MAG TPA: molybdopterin oxidoreductase family protein [Actinophytocola sp.]|uniref:molybdopterin-containing oxidoreductase family protein n=1 Tax=Actinophytocola sp. TaxID=1872138 RepID=UPI002DBD01EB|nr:molybdopterin oxidoreductase family protein [Actinophytocola sp.]HEU5470445.1 molybdopterin oxidoreductase family protein [Actinophytocola sp.]